MKYGWTDIEEIAINLDEAHGEVDPLTVSFPRLRALVEGLADFEPEPGQVVNEQILEAVQGAWIEEREDAAGGGDEDDEDGSRVKPHNPFR